MSNYVKDFQDDLHRTSERVRVFEINGYTYKVRCSDPYGLWRFEGRIVPAEIDGSYSTYDQAVKAAEGYERKRTKSGQINPDKIVSSKIKKTKARAEAETLSDGA